MSTVALSQSLGSLGDEIGQELARALGHDFADREMIAKSAEQFGESALDPGLALEARATLWERVADAKRHYMLSMEAVLFDLAARDRVVLSGRSSTILLARVPHVLRVRISAPIAVRARRVEHQLGLTYEAALGLVEQTDHDRIARTEFVHHVNMADPLLYDLALSTERLTVDRAVLVIQEALRDQRFTPAPDSLAAVRDLAVAARARASLLATPATRGLRLHVTCQHGRVVLAGAVADEGQRETAEAVVAALPGVAAVRDEITVVRPSRGQAPES
jgi:cytidylate kinase